MLGGGACHFSNKEVMAIKTYLNNNFLVLRYRREKTCCHVFWKREEYKCYVVS